MKRIMDGLEEISDDQTEVLFRLFQLLPQRTVVFIDYIANVFADTPGLNGVSVMA